jgi:hypothetical protein
VANPCPTGTCTLQDAPSFAWRANVFLSGEGTESAEEKCYVSVFMQLLPFSSGIKRLFNMRSNLSFLPILSHLVSLKPGGVYKKW